MPSHTRLDGWIARVDRRWLALLLPAAISAFGSAAIGLGIQIREPGIADEFSYLLAADTFLHGRLANPPHPFWQHFETFHVNQQPTYASKYPPLPGLFLAAGEWLGGHPIVGVWASCALMSSAIAWMLLAFLPARWALLGGLLAALRFGIVGAWSQTYYGVPGASALAGALLLGSVLRWLHRPRARHALGLGAALLLLANSRPFEGLLASIPSGVALLWTVLVRRSHPARDVWRGLAVPLAAILALGAAWMAYYDWRVTGDPLRLPYFVHEERYAPVPLFLWQTPKPEPEYNHPIMRDFWRGWAKPWYEEARDAPEILRWIGLKLVTLWDFFVRSAWSPPLLLIPLLWREPAFRLCAWTCGLLLAGTLVSTYGGNSTHYVAPATGALVALVVGGLRRMTGWRWRGRPLGAALAAALVLWTGLDLVPRAWAHEVGQDHWSRRRAELLERLSGDGERHLVLVRYGPDHSYLNEWVYNEADIDAARVVFAREMGPARDRALIDHFAGRKVWLLEENDTWMRLRPYPVQPGAPRPGT